MWANLRGLGQPPKIFYVHYALDKGDAGVATFRSPTTAGLVISSTCSNHSVSVCFWKIQILTHSHVYIYNIIYILLIPRLIIYKPPTCTKHASDSRGFGQQHRVDLKMNQMNH